MWGHGDAVEKMRQWNYKFELIDAALSDGRLFFLLSCSRRKEKGVNVSELHFGYGDFFEN